MTISYPDNTNNRAAISASGLTDSTSSFDIVVGGSERKLTLAELKKTGVQVVNVKQHGMIGDGVTDDTTTYLQILGDNDGTDNIIYFPPGTYLLGNLASFGYRVQEKITILGDNAVIKGDSQTGQYGAISIEASGSLYVSNLTFDTFDVPIYGHANMAGGVVYIEKCTIRNISTAIQSSGAANPLAVTVTKCNISAYTHMGIAWAGLSNAVVAIEHNRIGNASGTNVLGAISLGTTGVKECTSVSVIGNTIYDQVNTASPGGTCYGIFVEALSCQAVGNSLKNIYCENTESSDNCAGIYFKTRSGSITGNTCYNAGRRNGCIIWKGGGDSCVISSNSVTITDSLHDYAVGIRAYCEDVVVSDNYVNGDGADVRWGIAIGDAADNTVIDGNTVINCVYSAAGGIGISVGNTKHLSIKNNHISGFGSGASGVVSSAISLTPTTSGDGAISICNNTIQLPDFNPSGTSYTSGIDVYAHSSGNTGIQIVSNSITGCHAGVRFPSTTGYWSSVDISNNHIDGRLVEVGQPGGTGASYGVSANNVRKAKIAGNHIVNVYGLASTQCSAIIVTSNYNGGLSDVAIIDNVMFNIGSASAFAGNAIVVNTASFTGSDIVVSRNICRVAKRGILILGTASDDNYVITDNFLYDIGTATKYSFAGPANSIIYGNMDDNTLSTVNSSPLLTASTTPIKSVVALANGAAAATGTLTNAPTAGNPTKWIPINDNGTTRYIPAW